MTSYSPITETFYVLVTDGQARLVFYTKESANEYLKNRNSYENTSIQKVYSETKLVKLIQ